MIRFLRVADIMVEIIRDVLELGMNVSVYLNSHNEHVRKMYNSFRKKIVKVLRVIYMFRKDKENELYHQKLMELKKEANENIYQSNREILG